MRRLAFLPALALLLTTPSFAQPADANRLTYLDEVNPYYVSRTFPKLITPQWVGEEGVEAVVILAIDDMRGHEKWESYLRPILNRLKRIDGRAPVSIMTCQIDPKDPHLQTWLKEGLSLETHTIDHPCPLLAKSDLAKARSTYDRCVDLMNRVPGNKPVAFRMPCCDSLNTLSPRFFTEMFNQCTPSGNFLSIDSSVFNILTSNDPDLPRELVIDPDGRDKFRKYIPYDRSFVNTIEDYPYPYVIGRLCWEFPCVVPSDWEAQHYHKPQNPVTVRDLEAALDAIVLKQGVFTMVFHPYDWIKNSQMVDFIDYAVAKHGKKVKFLTFRDALERLNKNLLGGHPLRDPTNGQDYGVRLIDLNNDGYLDVCSGFQGNPHDSVRQTRLWSPKTHSWIVSTFPDQLAGKSFSGSQNITFRRCFGILRPDGYASLLCGGLVVDEGWHFDGSRWLKDETLGHGLGRADDPDQRAIHDDFRQHVPFGVRLRDLDGDGRCELILSNPDRQAVFAWSADKSRWTRLPFTLPPNATLVNDQDEDNGVRFVDVDEDGHADVIFANEKGYGLYLFESMQNGWSRKVLAGKPGEAGALPMITRKGTNNGAWFHSRHLWVQNEDTALLKEHVDRRSFNELRGNEEPQAKSPEASLHSMQVRPGFEVELVACEPLVQSPIAFAWGADGKLWVVEMGDYPLGVDGKGKPGGRIKYLEDDKGTGKYDKATVFLDGLPFPTGVTPWGKGVLVTCAPEIFYAEDTDGDGKADVRRPLFVGFHEGNQQHRVNGLVWGLDNWLYGANGDSGGRVRSVKTGNVVDLRGRDFRVRPDEGLIDLQAGQTQYGRSRDDWGNWFGNNNSNPMYHYALADHYIRRNPHVAAPDGRVQVSVTPGASRVYPISRTLPRFNDPGAANHFTSACSAIIYRDELFGPHFADNTFVSEPVHNLVHREIMTPIGVTFTSRRAPDEQQSEFLASSDNWFRPTMIQTGPDGALWIADMYRQVIEHPEWIPRDWQRRLDLRAGHDKGRIYRVYPVGKRPRAIPRLDRLDTAGLVAALDSPNGWQRDTAQQLLIHSHDPAAVPLLEKQAVEAQRPLCRLHALCTLDGLGALSAEVLKKALADPEPGVRRHAIRLCETLLTKSPELGMALVRLVHDADPQVRMQLAYTLGEWADPRAGEALGRLAVQDAGDRFLTTAVLSSVNKQNLDALLLTVLAGDKHAPPPAALTENLLLLANKLGDAKTLINVLDRVGAPENGHYAAWQYAALAGLLDALDQQSTTLAKFSEGKSDLRAAVDRLAPLFDAARAAMRNERTPHEERVQAIRLPGRGLGHVAEDRAALANLLVPQVEEAIQAAAVGTLGRLHDPAVPELLLRGWKGHGPALRSQILDVLFRRDDGLKATLAAVERKQVLPFEIDAARRQRLLQHRSEAIRTRAADLFAGSVNPDRQKVVDSYRSVLTLKGDAGRGTQVFTKTCATCHQLSGIGHQVGPDLASVGDKSPPALLIAILDPNRAVEARYINYVAQTKNGQTFTGVLASETGNSITLLGPDGKQQVILRTDLEELVSSNKSVMPEGLEKDLKPQDVADLIAFIRAGLPAPKRKAFDGNRPELVKPAADGSLQLLASKAEIYGPTLVFEKQHSNLGFWSSEADQAVWAVEVNRPGKCAVWLDWACEDSSAGNAYLLQAGLERLTGKVQGTGTWDDYRQAKVGEITLQAGRQEITFRSAGKIKGAMLDLRSVKLLPVSSR
jgi:putative membrane-bound dehydrogenase-like protein